MDSSGGKIVVDLLHVSGLWDKVRRRRYEIMERRRRLQMFRALCGVVAAGAVPGRAARGPRRLYALLNTVNEHVPA